MFACFSNIVGYFLLFHLLTNFSIAHEESTEEHKHHQHEIKEEFYLGYDVFWLNPNDILQNSGENFSIYCQESLPKSILHVWRSVFLLFLRVPKNYKLFGGENRTDVFEKYQSEKFWSPTSWVSWRDTCIDFPAFSQYCVGVDAHEKYAVQLVVRTVNYWKVLQTIIGIILFVSSPSLSKNISFHYASGISFGMIASVLILMYVLTKFIPKKSASYAFIALGYSLVAYLLQQFYHNLTDILTNYMGILLAYMFFSAVLSFIVCYRFGPVKDMRTIHIIQWTLQAISLWLIFFSTEYREVSTGLILLLLTYYLIPRRWTRWTKTIWLRYFPPKIKLLTETEFIEQGNRETKKALEELREYCRSPECHAWSTVMKLKDAKRFASFIEGSSHITDDEILLYDSEAHDADDIILTDDDEDRTVNTRNHVYSNSYL